MVPIDQPTPIVVPSHNRPEALDEWNCSADAYALFGINGSQMKDMYAPITDIDEIFSDDAPEKPIEKSMKVNNIRQSSLCNFVTSFLTLPANGSKEANIWESSPAVPSDILSEVLDDLDDLTEDPLFPSISVQDCMSGSAGTSRSAQQMKQLTPPSSQIKRPLADTVSSASPAKRQRVNEVSDSEESEELGIKFRFYQAAKWQNKFDELIEYKKQHGHCRVPHGYKPNPMLARWAKRQRYQYKLFKERKPSTMTEERIAALENLGFVWDSHGALWDERYSELQQFSQAMGHANVPSSFPPNPKLAIWVKCQRRQYKLLTNGQPSNMTLARVSLLNRLNFVWEVRRG